MKASIIFLISIAVLSFTATAQKKLTGVATNKYRINLPYYWGKGNKVWTVLNDKLPLVCEELKDKELCGDDCNPEYTVEFYLTEPIVFSYFSKQIIPEPYTNTRHLTYIQNQYPQNPERAYYANKDYTWQITTEYGFQCFLILMDTRGKILTKMILVDTNEVWKVACNVNLASGGTFSEKSPDSYIENNKKKLVPDIYELLAIVDKKMLSL